MTDHTPLTDEARELRRRLSIHQDSRPRPCTCLWPYPANCNRACDGLAIGPRLGYEVEWEKGIHV